MKIERDKWYLTRCGDKVRVVCVDAPGSLPVIGITKLGGPDCWTSDGCYVASKLEAHNDLVSEYVEPPKPREVWVYFIRGDVACSWSAQELEAKRPEDRAELPPLVKFREVIEA